MKLENNRSIQLAHAREKLRMTGKSPRKLGQENKFKLFDFIYKNGHITATVAQLLLSRTSGGLLNKLSKQNWLQKTATKSGTPKYYYTLSMQGLEEIEKQSFDLYKYPEINQFKVNQQQLRHYQIVQIATVNALNSKKIVDFETERMFASEGDKPGIKRPDVLWFTDNGKRIAVEVELSQKWDRAFDEFLLAIIRSLSSKDGVKAKFDRFLIITDSNAIRHNYIEAIQPGSIFYKWEKNHRDHWEVTKKLLVPDWLIQKVDFQLIKNTV